MWRRVWCGSACLLCPLPWSARWWVQCVCLSFPKACTSSQPVNCARIGEGLLIGVLVRVARLGVLGAGEEAFLARAPPGPATYVPADQRTNADAGLLEAAATCDGHSWVHFSCNSTCCPLWIKSTRIHSLVFVNLEDMSTAASLRARLQAQATTRRALSAHCFCDGLPLSSCQWLMHQPPWAATYCACVCSQSMNSVWLMPPRATHWHVCH